MNTDAEFRPGPIADAGGAAAPLHPPLPIHLGLCLGSIDTWDERDWEYLTRIWFSSSGLSYSAGEIQKFVRGACANGTRVVCLGDARECPTWTCTHGCGCQKAAGVQGAGQPAAVNEEGARS